MVHGVAVVREYASLVRYTTFRCIPAAVDHGVVVYGRFFFFFAPLYVSRGHGLGGVLLY